MTDTTELNKFQQKLAERRRAKEQEQASGSPSGNGSAPSGFDKDLVPDSGHERSEEDQQLDDVISRIDILDAYTRWCGKMRPEARGGQTEGIKISCPVPGHVDKNPSAWINTDKQTWYCAKCEQGGDALDIAAFHFNYPVPGYKTGARFHELRRDMARSLGYTFVKPPGAKSPIAIPPPEIVPEQEPQSGTDSVPEGKAAEAELEDGTVVSLFDPIPEPDLEFPTLDWKELVTADTFLDIYMDICSRDDVPEEYHFWNALIALGLAVGRDVKLYDQVPVLGNLFVCLLGNTGDGKSRSFYHLRSLLAKALPHKWDDPSSKGAIVANSMASAEALIHAFSKPVPDPVNPKLVAYYAPVRGLIEFTELSALTGRTSRQGNVLKPTMMDFYDGNAEISTTSMTTGKKLANEAFGSAFTTTQPKALRELITKNDADSGFLNRWVFASGRQKERSAIGGAVVDVTPAVEPLQAIHGWAGHGKTIVWSKEAAERFTEIFHSVLFPAKQSDETGFLVRVDLLMKKLILLLTVNEMLDEVPVRIVEMVYKMYPYLVAAYAVPAAAIGQTVYYEVMEEIRSHVKHLTDKSGGKGATMRELNQRLHRKKYPPRVIKEMLDYMVNTTGEIALNVVKNARGPETTRYRYVG